MEEAGGREALGPANLSIVRQRHLCFASALLSSFGPDLQILMFLAPGVSPLIPLRLDSIP